MTKNPKETNIKESSEQLDKKRNFFTLKFFYTQFKKKQSVIFIILSWFLFYLLFNQFEISFAVTLLLTIGAPFFILAFIPPFSKFFIEGIIDLHNLDYAKDQHKDLNMYDEGQMEEVERIYALSRNIITVFSMIFIGFITFTSSSFFAWYSQKEVKVAGIISLSSDPNNKIAKEVNDSFVSVKFKKQNGDYLYERIDTKEVDGYPEFIPVKNGYFEKTFTVNRRAAEFQIDIIDDVYKYQYSKTNKNDIIPIPKDRVFVQLQVTK